MQHDLSQTAHSATKDNFIPASFNRIRNCLHMEKLNYFVFIVFFVLFFFFFFAFNVYR